MIRTFEHSKIERFAVCSKVPVINGLTDFNHPCQLLADMQTLIEHRGDVRGQTVTWIGDGNNMCNSYLEAACQFDFQLRIAVPPGYEPDAALLKRAADRVVLLRDPLEWFCCATRWRQPKGLTLSPLTFGQAWGGKGNRNGDKAILPPTK